MEFTANQDSSANTTAMFHHWKDLPSLVKISILKLVPFSTLRHFFFLNRETYTLCKSLKFEVWSVCVEESDYLHEIQGMQDDEKVVDLTVAWAGPEDSGYPEDEIFCLSFLDDGNKGCYVRRQFEKDGRLATLYGVSYSQDMHAAALQVSFNFIKMFHVKSVKIAMRFLTPEIERPLKEQPPGIIQCEMFSIMTKEPTLATNFLRVLAPGCKLELYSSSLSTEDRVSLDTHFFDSAVVKSAPIVAIEYIAEIEDNQLALCRAHTISLTCPNITSRAVNQLILDWLPGKRKITSITLYGMRKPNKQEILLDVPTSSIIPWSEVLKCVPNADWWAKCKDTELSFGLRNFSGELILAILDSTSSSLSDPQW